MFKRKPRQDIKIQHPLAYELYQYRLGEFFTPGAEGEVFESLTTNPLISFRGPARLAGALSVLQPSQLQVPAMVRVSGIPTIAGQWILQGAAPTSDGQVGD